MGTYRLTKIEYLYGEDAEVEPIPAEIIVRRVETLNDHLAELLKVHYLARDTERINEIISAITFWNDLDKEEK